MDSWRGKEGKTSSKLTLSVAIAVAIPFLGWCAEPQKSSNEVARVPSADASKALASFQIKPGFRLEIVAGPPLIEAPVAMAFARVGSSWESRTLAQE